jgi:hypothetical protein
MWLTAVLNMEDKLNTMFMNLSGHPNDANVNLGLKYAASGANIWSNDYVKEKALAAAQTAAPEKPIADPRQLQPKRQAQDEVLTRLSTLFYEDSQKM